MKLHLATLCVAWLAMAECAVAKPHQPARRPDHDVTWVETSPIPGEQPDDRWMPRAKLFKGGGQPHCGPWVRGPHESVQVNVDKDGCNIVGDAANEPSIAIDPTNGGRIIIGWRQFDTVESNFRQAGWAHSHDAGHTWMFRGVLEPGRFRSDPVLDSDAEGNLYYCSYPGFSRLFVANTVDGRMSWRALPAAPTGDKTWMAIDRTDSIGRGNIYLSWTRFVRSTDGGQTFETAWGSPYTKWGTIAVGPDGEVYTTGEGGISRSASARDPEQDLEFEFSTRIDLGGNWGYYEAPNPGGLIGQPWIAVDHSFGPTRGHVYVLQSVDPPSDDPLDVMFIRSTDGGETWSAPVRINDDPLDTNAWQWFAMMSVAPNGRIDAVWNDTRNSGQASLSELYYAYSTDGGITWSENVPVSPMFDSHVGYPNQNKIGDYYDMISDDLGVSIAYAATFNNEQDVYFLRLGPLDCNGNGLPDSNEIADGTSADCNKNGVPDECEMDCNDNGTPDECDIVGGASEDDNENGIPDECQFRIYVDASANRRKTGNSWSNTLKDLQEALQLASTGFVEEIWVKAGTYRPRESFRHTLGASFWLVDGVPVYGGFAGGETDRTQRDPLRNPTILSGDLLNNDDSSGDSRFLDNSDHVVSAVGVGSNTILDGFVITAGFADDLAPGSLGAVDLDSGGGMYVNRGSPTIRNCAFRQNFAAAHGGGLHAAANITLLNCEFTENAAEGDGGGANIIGDSNVTDCAFAYNYAGGSGGGLCTHGNLALRGTLFRNNAAVDWGGGLTNSGEFGVPGTLTVLNSTFDQNWSEWYGGALACHYNFLVLVNCRLNGNGAARAAGAVWSNTSATATVLNTTFTANIADTVGGFYNRQVGGSATIANCIFSGNTDHRGPVEAAQLISDELTINYSYVQGWTGVLGGVANIGGYPTDDPLFVDAYGADGVVGSRDDDLRLSSDSPCANTGDPNYLPEAGETDLDGHARMLCGRIDMGAYESGIGDFNCDRAIGLLDFASWDPCMTGPEGSLYTAGCTAFDFELDNDVDLRDFAGFQTRVNTP